MKTKSFKSYSDSGHGWLAVKREDLVTLGILEQITSCSYQKGNTVYLEEDCDASTFVKAFQDKYKSEPIIVSQVNKSGQWPDRSIIRNYSHFTFINPNSTVKLLKEGDKLSLYGKEYTFVRHEKSSIIVTDQVSNFKIGSKQYGSVTV